MSTPSTSNTGGYLSPKAAADYCGIAYDTFTKLARQEGLRPDGIIGRRKRYTRATLDRLMRTLRARAERGQ